MQQRKPGKSGAVPLVRPCRPACTHTPALCALYAAVRVHYGADYFLALFIINKYFSRLCVLCITHGRNRQVVRVACPVSLQAPLSRRTALTIDAPSVVVVPAAVPEAPALASIAARSLTAGLAPEVSMDSLRSMITDSC